MSMDPSDIDLRTGTGRVPGPVVALIASGAQFMVVLDSTIVNVALPSMRRSLGLTETGQQWVITSYLLVFGGLLLLGGRAADVFGRRRIFLIGLAVFCAASLLGGLAPAGWALIAARAAQGLGAAMLAPAPMALIAATYPEGPSRVRAIGLWSATAASAGTAGVVLGGVLTQLADWRWVMFVNVPIGAVLILAGLRGLAPDRQVARPRAAELDLPGAVTVTVGLAALVFAISGVTVVGWGAPRTIGLLVFAVLALAAFAVLEARSARPLLRPALIRMRGVVVGNAAMWVAGALTNCIVLFLTLFLQDAYGFDPLRGGLALLPMTVAVAAASMQARRIMGRLGVRGMLICGALVLAAGLVWQSRFTPDGSYWGQILVPQIVIGLGLGLFVLPSTTTAMTGVPGSEMGLAAALINTTRQLGGGIGVAVLTTVATAVSGGPAPADLAHGYSVALLACAGLACAAVVLGMAVPRSR